MGSRLSINAREMADLQLIINSYEEKIGTQGQSERTPLRAWRPIDNLQIGLSHSLASVDPAKAIGDAFGDLNKNFNQVGESVSSVTVDKINEGLEKIYNPGSPQEVPREATVDIVPGVKAELEGTVAGMKNAFDKGDIGAGFSVLLNDCIPCNLRLEGITFEPDISFLESLALESLKIAEIMKNFVEGLINTDPLNVDFCLNLNLVNFTCIPDFHAMSLMIAKGINLSVKSPSFKLPGLSDIMGAIFLPILGALSNMAQLWINVIIKPVDCILLSMDTLVKKLRFAGSKIADDFSFRTQVNVGEISVGNYKTFTSETENKKRYKVPGTGQDYLKEFAPSPDFKKALKKIDTEKFFNNAAKKIEEWKAWLYKLRNKIFYYINKFIKKFNNLLGHFTKSIHNLTQSIVEIQESVSQLQVITILFKLFNAKFNACNDRDEAFKNTPEDAAREVAKRIPGVTTAKTKDGVEYKREIKITKDEADALGLEDLDLSGSTIVLNSPTQSTTDESVSINNETNTGVIIKRNLIDGDCHQIALREQFVSVNKLVNSF